MKRRIWIWGALLCMAFGTCACSGKAESEREESSSSGPAAEDDGSFSDGEEGTDILTEEDNGTVPEEDSSADASRSGEEGGLDFVGIRAHVKEIHGKELLISSDSDDYPGAFTVTGAEELSEFSKLQGGTSLQILMRKLEEADGQGNAKYRAERIVVLSGDEEIAHADILLTDAPAFTLQDALSSRMDFVELRSGNYTWNVEENGVGTGGIACGTDPLSEAAMDFTVKLKVPEYNGMDGAFYLFSTEIAPDTLIVRRWDAADIGNSEAKEESITKYYYQSPILELEAGKVYEFTAVWKEKNTGRNKFYGNASYVLVTE